jgi:hypothetical protein
MLASKIAEETIVGFQINSVLVSEEAVTLAEGEAVSIAMMCPADMFATVYWSVDGKQYDATLDLAKGLHDSVISFDHHNYPPLSKLEIWVCCCGGVTLAQLNVNLAPSLY